MMMAYNARMASTCNPRDAFSASLSGPWVKLCGMRDAASALALASLRPEAIGLNFYERSPRQVTIAIATEICRSLPAGVMPVGVFVNATFDAILRTADETGLAAVQLHGDEPPSLLAELRAARAEIAIVRAWRVGDEGLSSLAEHLAECSRLGATPDAVLVDAKVAGSYGGTGTTAPWNVLRGYDPAWPPLILAGGLTPENVTDAVATVRPFGVDTAGGIESSPGVKDPARAAAFISRARMNASPS
jgi:phosphoribosylanthranilate isomerase